MQLNDLPDSLAPGPYNVCFPGQYFDAESGLHYNRFRYYAPELGRYVSADPIGQAGGVNVYRYAEASPLSFGDPFGLITDSLTAGCRAEKASEWRGPPGSTPGSSEGSWYNPDTDVSVHPDRDHPAPIGPHNDVQMKGNKAEARGRPPMDR